MGFRGLLRHTLAIVTPGADDLDNLDEAGFPVRGDPSTIIVPGLVQPRDSHEISGPYQDAAELTDVIIFLEPMPLSGASYITYADDDGPIENAPRFQINGIQQFNFGSAPHLEVLATVVGNSDFVPAT